MGLLGTPHTLRSLPPHHLTPPPLPQHTYTHPLVFISHQHLLRYCCPRTGAPIFPTLSLHSHPSDLLHVSLQDSSPPEVKGQAELEAREPCLLCHTSVSVCTWRAGARSPGASSPGVRCSYEAHLGSCPESRSSAGPHCHPGREGWRTEAKGIPGRLASESTPAIYSAHLPLPAKAQRLKTRAWSTAGLQRDP